MTTHQFQLGEFTCAVLLDGISQINLHKIFPTLRQNASDEQLQTYEAAMYNMPMLVDTGSRRVLIDTGLGRDVGDGEGQLLARLNEIGVSADSIDTIILTHGHWDHIGGITDDDGNLVYKNAEYYFPEIEWKTFTSESDLAAMAENMRQWAQENLPPIADRVKLFTPEIEITPGFRAVDASGHTPGHVVIAVESGGEQLLFLSDAALNPFQMEFTDVWAAFDMDHEAANACRRKLYRTAADGDYLVHGYHFPFPGLGHIKKDGASWRWLPLDS